MTERIDFGDGLWGFRHEPAKILAFFPIVPDVSLHVFRLRGYITQHMKTHGIELPLLLDELHKARATWGEEAANGEAADWINPWQGEMA